MGDEQLQVLQMVAAGTITPEQGEDLLGALETSNSRSIPVRATERSETSDWSGTRASRGTLVRLSAARMHGVTPEYIRSLAGLGYDQLPLEKYIELRTHGITPEYIREMREGGHGDLSPEDLVEMRVSGVDPEFVRDMIDLGFGDRDSSHPTNTQSDDAESAER